MLLARLKRLETAQATRLDQALLDLNSDLVARLALRDRIDEDRLGILLSHLRQILDR